MGQISNINHLVCMWKVKIRGSENQERNIVAIKNQICNQTCEKYIRIDLFELCRERFSLVQINLIFCYCHLNPLYLLSNSF